MYMEKNHEEVQWVEMAARNQGMANYSNERKRQNGGKMEEKPLAAKELMEPIEPRVRPTRPREADRAAC